MARRGPKPKPKPMDDYCPSPAVMSLKSGEAHATEEDAEKRLADGRRVSSQTMDDRTFYLSREQVALRQSKEVLNIHGVPDGRLFQGIYRRTHNPLSGGRPRGSRHADE